MFFHISENKMIRFLLSDSSWDRLQNSLCGAGCYITDNLRNNVEGMFWRTRTGSPWRDLPDEFGKWNAVYRLFNRWNRNGVWQEVLELTEEAIDYRTAYIDGTYIPVHQHASGAAKGKEAAVGPSRGGTTTKIHGVCDRNGNPVSAEVTAGNVSDIAHAEKIVDDLVPLFDEVCGDKGYDSDLFRIDILEAGSTPIIPTKSNSKRKNPGFHRSKYKKRHKIENLFARLKHFRGIATRYDKLKEMFQGTVNLGLIIIWLGATL